MGADELERAYRAEATRIRALCQAGRVDEARRETRSFLAENPEGPLSVNVRSLCGTN